MARVIIRHYTEKEPLNHTEETAEVLQEMMEQYRPRYEALGHTLEMEQSFSEPEEAEEFLNLVTLSCPEVGHGETPLERITAAEVVQEEISSSQGSRSVRGLKLHGKSYLALPRGMVAEGLLRTLLTLIPVEEGDCAGGCQGCSGRCSL
jgi:hypothetical protein